MIGVIIAIVASVQYEVIAQASLIFFAITFVNDPFPPQSRIASLIGMAVIYLLNKIKAKYVDTPAPVETTEKKSVKESSKKES